MKFGWCDGVDTQQQREAERTTQIGFLVRKMYQKNQALWTERVGAELSSPQASVLLILHEMGAHSLSDLGRQAAMDSATVRGVVKRLCERGHVSITDDSSDRRKVVVEIKLDGRAAIEAILPLLPAVADATFEPLNVAERVALEYLLVKATG